MVPIGLILRSRGVGISKPVLEVVSSVPPIVAALWAASSESTSGATWGKKRVALRVVSDSGARTFGQVLLRNLVKIALPWQLGHLVAIGAARGGFDDGKPRTIAYTAATYVVAAASILAVIVGSGRGLHDRIAGTSVKASRRPR